MAARTPLGVDNHLGTKGWLAGGKWGLERYLFWLHRVSGLALLVYFLAHIVVTSSRALGRESWEQAMGTVSGAGFELAEYLVVLAFVFHAVNGLRLLLTEVGVTLGAPTEPIYPYQTSVDRQRPLSWAVLIVSFLLAVAAAADLLLSH